MYRTLFLNLVVIILSFSIREIVNSERTACESIPLSSGSSSVYVTCQGNFSDMDKLKQYLESIQNPISEFTLENALLDALPPDVFHNVPNLAVRKVIFNNVSLELLDVPELGEPPLKSIKDTVENFEVYDSPTVFAWNFTSLSFQNLRNFVIEDSNLISITVPLFYWPELQFLQIQNASVRWIHPTAFQKNKNLVICSLARNRISYISRSMFPKPALKLYSLDLSFNRLESFADDMFTEMDMLHELKLDKNRLKEISMTILRPVWENLSQLWLNDNGVECESLCWVSDKAELPMFLESSKCKYSRRLHFIDAYLIKCKRPLVKL